MAQAATILVGGRLNLACRSSEIWKQTNCCIVAPGLLVPEAIYPRLQLVP